MLNDSLRQEAIVRLLSLKWMSKSKQTSLGKSHNSTQDEINWDITRKET